MGSVLDGGVNEYALYYGLGGAIGLFAIILLVLCMCLCYIRCCKPRTKPKPRPVAKGASVSFTGNFESRDSIVEDHVHSTGINHIYEDLDTIRLEKNKLVEKEKAKANPENGEKEIGLLQNGHTTLVTVDENTIPRNGHVHVSNGTPAGTITNEGTTTVIVSNGTLPHGEVPNGRVPNGGVPNGGAPNGGAPNGGAPNGGVPNGGVPNGQIPNGGVPNGGVPSGGAPNGGILTNQNASAAVFTAQVPVSYHNRSQTLPSGVGSGSKADKEPIYARPGRYFKTKKKKVPTATLR